MVMDKFSFGRCPRIVFGAGTFGELGDIAGGLGRYALLVTGASSLRASGRLSALVESLERRSMRHFHLVVKGEPSPELVDKAVREHRGLGIDLVVAVGGGSAVDAGKAVSAMLPLGAPVMDYLEGVGNAAHTGVKLPFIAVPTTAGTGSEATSNAVLSRTGPGGFKRSLRHDNFYPDVALVDPELALSCPPAVSASCGMDALTQLLESYVSVRATPLTDALAWSGLERVRNDLSAVCAEGAGDVEARAGMAYAALVSGMVLANAGLGVVHGFASAIGGLFAIPHGVVCGTLLGEATRVNISHLERTGARGEEALQRYARAGAMLSGWLDCDVREGCGILLDTLDAWTEELELPRLGEYGLKDSDIDAVLEETSLKANPAALSRGELKEILSGRM
ncbi:MAG: iron-containing alcohol dehydrogenase [Actinobacteria bacterium]|nr:iron-containing alcohol dehydrogenase [Actinomycetota bacterium]